MAYFGKFLLIENDTRILDVIQKDLTLKDRYPYQICRSFSETKNHLEKSLNEIRVIFLSERLARTFELTELEKFISELKMPIYLIEDKKPFEEIRKLISKTIPSPKTHHDLINLIQNQIAEVHDFRKNQSDGQEKDLEFAAEDNKYIGLALRDFVITPKSYFNTYLKLSPGRYIKIINAGDELSQDIIKRYDSKNVEEFFVPKDEHEKYVHLLANISQKAVRSENLNSSHKIKCVVKLGANVTNNLLKCGFTPDRMYNAEMFLDQSVTLLKHMRIKNEVINSFLADIDKNEHSAAVAFISGILANHLGFGSSKSIKVVGSAALLHDIGLLNHYPDFNEGDPIETDLQKEIFANHPGQGAELLRSTGLFDEVICHAVENHHRRRKGENANRRSSSVNLVTEIICVSDEFFNTVIYPGYSPELLSFFLENELKNFSNPVEKAFLALTKGKKAA